MKTGAPSKTPFPHLLSASRPFLPGNVVADLLE
jgi:hypothetical protein